MSDHTQKQQMNVLLSEEYYLISEKTQEQNEHCISFTTWLGLMKIQRQDAPSGQREWTPAYLHHGGERADHKEDPACLTLPIRSWFWQCELSGEGVISGVQISAHGYQPVHVCTTESVGDLSSHTQREELKSSGMQGYNIIIVTRGLFGPVQLQPVLAIYQHKKIKIKARIEQSYVCHRTN